MGSKVDKLLGETFGGPSGVPGYPRVIDVMMHATPEKIQMLEYAKNVPAALAELWKNYQTPYAPTTTPTQQPGYLQQGYNTAIQQILKGHENAQGSALNRAAYSGILNSGTMGNWMSGINNATGLALGENQLKFAGAQDERDFALANLEDRRAQMQQQQAMSWLSSILGYSQPMGAQYQEQQRLLEERRRQDDEGLLDKLFNAGLSLVPGGSALKSLFGKKSGGGGGGGGGGSTFGGSSGSTFGGSSGGLTTGVNYGAGTMPYGATDMSGWRK